MGCFRMRLSTGAVAKVVPSLGNVGVVGVDYDDLRNLDPDDAGKLGAMLKEARLQARGEHPLVDGELDVDHLIERLREEACTA